MPGYATWKTLYHDEYRQLREEGYPVGASATPDLNAEFLPFPAGVRATLTVDAISEADGAAKYKDAVGCKGCHMAHKPD